MGIAADSQHSQPHFTIHDPGHAYIDATNPLIGFGLLSDADCLRERLHFENPRMLEYCARDDERQRQFIKYLWTQYCDRFPNEGMASLSIDHFDLDDQVRAYTWDGTVIPTATKSTQGVEMPEKALHLLLGCQDPGANPAPTHSRSEKERSSRDKDHKKRRSGHEREREKKPSLFGWMVEGDKKSSKSKSDSHKKSSRSKHEGDKKTSRSKHVHETILEDKNEELLRPNLDQDTEDEREVAMRSVIYTLLSPPGTNPRITFKGSEWAVTRLPDHMAGSWSARRPSQSTQESAKRSTWFHDLADRAHVERGLTAVMLRYVKLTFRIKRNMSCLIQPQLRRNKAIMNL